MDRGDTPANARDKIVVVTQTDDRKVNPLATSDTVDIMRRSYPQMQASSSGTRLSQVLHRVPRAGYACFLIAFVNAAIWGLVVPPFQVPDEVAHFAYVQYLAETGKPPPQGAGAPYSPQENAALDGLYFSAVIGHPPMHGVLTPAEDHALRAAIAANPSPLSQGGSTPVTNQPPLYYALEAVPYWLSPSHEILTRLFFMRLLSALMAACTVLAIFLFLRELWPGTPWTWSVGALTVAFQPTFNFIAAGVQGDNLLFLAASLTFLMLLRTYRRGFTTARAVAIGGAVAVGVLGKLTFIALLPGIALALALLGWRDSRNGWRHALQMVSVVVAVIAVPVALYALLNVTVWDRGSFTAGAIAGATASHVAASTVVTMHETLDYIWELYLPPLWFMHHIYFGNYPVWSIWFDGSIGHFGWLDYTFPQWVYADGRYVFYVLLALALCGVARLRGGIRPLLPLLGCFAVTAIGLLAAIGYAGIRYRLRTGSLFEQARYLFPLLAFYGTFVVVAARGLPRRWAPLGGALIVILAMAHGLFAETLTISRYYG
jgi:hypothetical protein